MLFLTVQTKEEKFCGLPVTEKKVISVTFRNCLSSFVITKIRSFSPSFA